MCGFVGIVGRNKIDLEKSANLIFHRGPDKTSIEYKENYSVAFNRLSIIDVSDDGMQPFKSQDVTVYFNGEIYNYIELQKFYASEFTPKTRADGEILPFLYKKHGINFLHKVNGMFSMVIFDEKIKKAFFIRDRFAEKPLYYKLDNNIFYFTSEIKALSSLLSLKEDIENLNININCLFLPQGLSLFKGIHSVNPGSYIELKYSDNLNFQEVKWYQPLIKIEKKEKKFIFEKMDHLLNVSLKIRTRSDVPIGIFLSGGLDSSCVAYYAKKNYNHNLTSLTAFIEGKFDVEKNLTDIDLPKKFSSNLDIINHQVNFDFEFFDNNFIDVIFNCEELFLDSGNLMYYGLAKKAKELGLKVILKGNGGDEIFGGYPWQRKINFFPNSVLNFSFKKNLKFLDFFSSEIISKNRKFQKLSQILFTPKIWHAETLADGIFFEFFSKDYKKNYLKKIGKVSQKIFEKCEKSLTSDINNNINFLNIYYPLGGSMYMSDMSAMFNSVENRSPLMDHNLFEFMLSISDSLKNKNGQKGIVREFLSWKNFPDYVTEAKKSGPTMNVNNWLNQLNKRNYFKLFLNKNKKILEYIFGTKINFDIIVNSKIQKNYFILFGFLSIILWFKIHVEKKFSYRNNKLTEVLLDI